MLYDSKSNVLEFQTQCSEPLNSMLLGSKVNALSTQTQCFETLKSNAFQLQVYAFHLANSFVGFAMI